MKIEKNPRNLIGLLTLGAVSMATVATAQQAEAQRKQKEQNRPKQEERKLVETTSFEYIRLLSFNSLDDRDIVNAGGETLGEIGDMAIDPHSGVVTYAVLERDGLIGLKEKLFAVPLDAFARFDRKKLQLNLAEKWFEPRPGFNDEEWPLKASENWLANAHGAPPKSRAQRSDTDSAQRITEVRKASDFVGMQVSDNAGAELGEITDLYIDPKNSRVTYAVLERGGMLGIGDDYYAIPWELVRVGKDTAALTTNKDRVKRGPKQDDEDARAFGDPDWAVTVYRFYDLKPYWGA